MGARSRLVYLEGKKRKSTCLAPSPGRPYSEPRGRIVEKQGVFDEEFLNLGATDGELERLHGRPRYANAGISRLQGAKQVREKKREGDDPWRRSDETPPGRRCTVCTRTCRSTSTRTRPSGWWRSWRPSGSRPFTPIRRRTDRLSTHPFPARRRSGGLSRSPSANAPSHCRPSSASRTGSSSRTGTSS